MIASLALFTLGIVVGVLLALVCVAFSQRRHERDQARRQFQLQTESLRRDLESLRSDVHRMLQPRSTTP